MLFQVSCMAWMHSPFLLPLRLSWRRCRFPWARVSQALVTPRLVPWSILSWVSNLSPSSSRNVKSGLPTLSPGWAIKAVPLSSLSCVGIWRNGAPPFTQTKSIGVMPESMTSDTAQLLRAHFQSALLLDIGSFRSLSALPLPGS